MITRRHMISAAASISAAVLASPAWAKSATGETSGKAMRKTRFLLVHGAWHGGWCWRDVAAGLREAGHEVFTPTLTGLGERAHLLSPEIGLQTHVDDILAVIRFNELEDFILVGHSYGGMVISGVADKVRDKIRHIVYLDAALPRDGETMISQGAPRSADMLAATEQQLRALAPEGIAMQAFPPEFLGIPKNHPGYRWVARHMTPHPLKTWLDPIALPNGGSAGLPRTYIHCNAPVLPNSSFGWHYDQTSKDIEWTSLTLATGHDAMVTAPHALTRILRSL
ncbi:Pimeloyl-ACP methyl ester carboxylesterase [Parasphingorhabdus marina DSM 22363]|uniref:Pimeloyl-ACP methyl ester carboxylesterase n=1 Tax=Parasphingorhabdus marina DSM 22363 TaxID=1123272 RepID=A0A1N6DFH2_9SPHN|nr:alpha/beta fold hydrolase [Parasphingorhabdus marina]SIN69457.1 Pimeloyl-ACP methyl ester carboxylesterase [Parasphingorhabdus marina DSM 22363]